MKRALLVLTILLLASSVYAAVDTMPDYSLWYDPHYWTSVVVGQVSYKFITERPVTIKTYDLLQQPVTVNYNQTLFVVDVGKTDEYVTTSDVYKRLVPGLIYRLEIRDKSFMAGIDNHFITKIFAVLGGRPFTKEQGQ